MIRTDAVHGAGTTDRLGYTKCNYVAAFQEIELELLPLEHEQRVVHDVLATATLHSVAPRIE